MNTRTRLVFLPLFRYVARGLPSWRIWGFVAFLLDFWSSVADFASHKIGDWAVGKFGSSFFLVPSNIKFPLMPIASLLRTLLLCALSRSLSLPCAAGGCCAGVVRFVIISSDSLIVAFMLLKALPGCLEQGVPTHKCMREQRRTGSTGRKL